MTTPADELEAAAAKLRALTQATTEAPWTRWTDQEGIPGWDGMLFIGDNTPADAEESNPVARVYVEEDARYIAAMHPGVGAALAKLLESTAELAANYPDLARDHNRAVCDDYACDVMGNAIALARAINGGEQR